MLHSDLQRNSLGQEAEAAAQYLNINIADGEDYKKNEFVQTVANNLRRVANLEEAIPYYGEHIVSLRALQLAWKCN